MKTTTGNKNKRKRSYNNRSPLEKIAGGEPWKLGVTFENDVTEIIVKEKEGSPNGGDYQKIVNNLIRLGAKAKSKSKK